MKTLEQQLKDFINRKESLIKLYDKFPSEDLRDRIIELGKTIGTIDNEIRFRKLFNK